MRNNEIKTEKQLQVVLEAVDSYYRNNALKANGKNLTVSDLLYGAVGVAKCNLADAKDVQE